jgi:type I restriction enzyme, S subunit
LPPLSEQHRIVEILDQADALRKKRVEAEAKAAHILPALFYKIFGDPVTNPKGWKSATLGDVIVDSQYGTSVWADAGTDGLFILRMNNIQSDGELDLADLKFVSLNKRETDR